MENYTYCCHLVFEHKQQWFHLLDPQLQNKRRMTTQRVMGGVHYALTKK
jgi:hypothetical protein